MAHVKLIFVMFMLCSCLSARGEAAQTILFDNGHGERFKVGADGPLQLSGLCGIFLTVGAQVGTLEKPISDESLTGVDGLVISGPFAPLTPVEIEALIRFMQRGGKLSVMLHIAPPMSTLLDRLQITYTNGVIQERQNIIGNNPQDFRVNRFGKHPVLQGVPEFSLYGVWGLINMDSSTRVVAATGSNAWVDLARDKIQKKEETASFGVALAGDIGKGGFLVFGDDAIFQNKFLDENNKKLAANLAAWLK